MSRRKRGKRRKAPAIPEPAESQRVEPYCSHFEWCGGCTLQHHSYESQLQLKQQLVDTAFDRPELESTLAEAPVAQSILPAPKIQGYRNKLEYTYSRRRWLTPQEIAGEQTFEYRDGAGFHMRGFYDRVLDIEHCFHQADPSNQLRIFLRDYCRKEGLSFYDIAENEGDIRSLTVRTTEDGQTMAIVMFGTEMNQQKQKLLQDFQEEFPELNSLYYIVNTGKNSSPVGHTAVHVTGEEYISETCGHLRLCIHPASFFQTNTSQAEQLYALVEEWAHLQGTEHVYDLYSGIGSIGLFLARSAAAVHGVEIIPEAVAGARENALSNSIANADFFVGEAEKVCNQAFFAQNGPADLVIVDPPRPGLHKNLIQHLLDIEAPRIIYISCNPQTQADDLQQLCQKYKIIRRRAVDMFPQTMHVENVVELALR